MSEIGEYLLHSLLVGTGATAATDVWSLVRRRLFGIPLPDYGLVGRWLACLPRGRFLHNPISATLPVRGERMIGWAAHYSIGVAFAAMLLIVWGLEWVRQPNVGPALIVGIATVAAPFLLMQPGMGAGIAASRTPRPGIARFNSIVTHAVFGLGLYLTAAVTSFFRHL